MKFDFFTSFQVVLMSIRDNYCIRDVYKKSGFGYSWTIGIIKELKKEGLIFTKSKGRRTCIYLTHKGFDCKINLLKIKEKIEN